MTRFARGLTSFRNPWVEGQPVRATTFSLFLIFVLTLACYLVPWVVNPGVSLSPGGYDLAEWATIHPAAMAENPPLLTGLLLRLPLVCATLALAFFVTLTRRSRMYIGIVVILMGIALLPPFEFVDDRENWNYRQQLALAVVTVLGGILGLTGWLNRLRLLVGSGATIIGAGAALVGLWRALPWMQAFDLPVQVGAGGILTALLLVVLLVAGWQTGQRQHLRRPIRASQH
jgi:hypothetical protein